MTITIASPILLAIYLLPSMIALVRWHHQRKLIILTNVLLGWTVLAWIVTMVWACAPLQPIAVLKARRKP